MRRDEGDAVRRSDAARARRRSGPARGRLGRPLGARRARTLAGLLAVGLLAVGTVAAGPASAASGAARGGDGSETSTTFVRGANAQSPANQRQLPPADVLVVKTAVLCALGVWEEPYPTHVQQVCQVIDLDPYVDLGDRDDLQVVLERADDEGVVSLTAMRAGGTTPSPAVEVALGALSDDDWNLIADEAYAAVAAEDYDQALADLLGAGGASQPAGAPFPQGALDAVLTDVDVGLVLDRAADTGLDPATTPDGTTADTTADTRPSGAPTTSAPAATPTTTAAPASSGSSTPVLLALLGVLALVVLALVAVVLGRRRDGTADAAGSTGAPGAAGSTGSAGSAGSVGDGGAGAAPTTAAPSAAAPSAAAAVPTDDQRRARQADDLLDVANRLTRARDLAEAERISVVEAVRLTGADGGGFIDVRADGLRVTHQSPDAILVPERIGEGVVARVIDTGQPVATVSQTEPAVSQLPVAFAAVPVIARGAVRAVLVVIRHGVGAFDEADIALLTKLAPVSAASLETFDRLRTAEASALVDPLTGLGNRRGLDQALDDATRGLGDGTGFSVLMVDVDHFKHFNDTNGHEAGDDALRAVAGAITWVLRDGDAAFRFGGEEFCIVLPGATEAQAAGAAERIRAAVADVDLPGAAQQPGGRLTVSIGVADATEGAADQLLGAADRALYAAKHGGRDRVVRVSEVPLDPSPS